MFDEKYEQTENVIQHAICNRSTCSKRVCVRRRDLYLVSCAALNTLNYCEAYLTVTSCLGHRVFWGHTLSNTHTSMNGYTSCCIPPDETLDSNSSKWEEWSVHRSACVLPRLSQRHHITLAFCYCVITAREKATHAKIKPWVSTGVWFTDFYWRWKVMFVDVKLHTCDWSERAQSRHLLSLNTGTLSCLCYVLDLLPAVRSPLLIKSRTDENCVSTRDCF